MACLLFLTPTVLEADTETSTIGSLIELESTILINFCDLAPFLESLLNIEDAFYSGGDYSNLLLGRVPTGQFLLS